MHANCFTHISWILFFIYVHKIFLDIIFISCTFQWMNYLLKICFFQTQGIKNKSSIRRRWVFNAINFIITKYDILPLDIFAIWHECAIKRITSKRSIAEFQILPNFIQFPAYNLLSWLIMHHWHNIFFFEKMKIIWDDGINY